MEGLSERVGERKEGGSSPPERNKPGRERSDKRV
jgi:hypothetical protein